MSLASPAGCEMTSRLRWVWHLPQWMCCVAPGLPIQLWVEAPSFAVAEQRKSHVARQAARHARGVFSEHATSYGLPPAGSGISELQLTLLVVMLLLVCPLLELGTEHAPPSATRWSVNWVQRFMAVHSSAA